MTNLFGSVKDIVLVALGGMIGTLMRHAINSVSTLSVPVWLVERSGVYGFPLGTLCVNMIGTFLIALIATLSGLVQYPNSTDSTRVASLTSILSPAGRLLLITGFCGGLTTFSSLMLDCVQLLESRSYTALCVYCIGTIAGAIVCFSAGWWCGRKLLILFSLPSPQ